MTLVAFKNGVMAADSCSYTQGMRYPIKHPKITRCSLGLVGCAGLLSDIIAIHAWVAGGMRKQKVALSGDEDECLAILWAKPDRTVWWGNHRLVFVEYCAPTACGETTACHFAEGAMWAGLSAERAVRLATKHCLYASGKVQVERL
jgi:hypothetical protein